MNPECGDERCPGCTNATVTAHELGLRNIEKAAYAVQLRPNVMSLLELVHSWNEWKRTGEKASESAMAMLCLKSLDFLKFILLNDSEEAKYCEQILVHFWPLIFKWITILNFARFQGDHADSPATTFFEEEVIHVTARALLVLVQIPTLADTIASTRQLLETIAFMWFLEDKTTLSRSASSVSTLVGSFLVQLTDRTPFWDKMLDVAEGDPETVLRIACSRIERGLASNSDDLAYERSLDNMAVLLYSASATGHKLRRACLKVGVIPTCITFLKRVVTVLAANKSDPSLWEMLYPAFSCIRSCLEIGNGYTEVLQAVKCGLVTVFIECSPFLPRMPSKVRDEMFYTFTHILPKYLVFRQITKATNKSLSRLMDGETLRHIQGTPAYDILIQLRDQAAQNHSLVARSRTTRTLCDNWKCSQSRTKSELLACEACHFAWYCSRECQKVAWKAESNHKKTCPLYRDLYLRYGPARALKDKTFLYELSSAIVRSAIPNLPEVVKERYPSFSLPSLVVIVDFLQVPPTCSLHPRDEVMHTRRTNDPFEALVAKPQFTQWRGQLLVVNYIGLGEDGATMQPTFIDLNSWDHDSLNESGSGIDVYTAC